MNLKVALLTHQGEENTAMNQVVKCIRAIEENYNHLFTIHTFTPEFRNNLALLDQATINSCKNSENNKGYVQNNFFNIKIENNYKLKTSVFTNRAFEIMKFHKNRIEMMIGNLKVSAKKKDLLAQPV